MVLEQRPDRIAAIVVAALVLVALAIVFLLPSDALLSAGNTDMVSEFVASRAFLADSLAHGHLPLWNPYTYGGQPFLGGFESEVLYPPSLFFLVLPLARALNFLMLLHLIILGWGMERWARSRGLTPWAAGLAGFVMPLSGPVFPHLYAGHLSNLCTMAWSPWIFLGLETWVRRGGRRGLFLASGAICLQLLAGHVQYFFYTAVAAGLQALVFTIAEPSMRRRALSAVGGCYLAAMSLGAAQLLPGLAAAAEGIRRHNLDYSFAAMFGFPPENILTVIAPGFFGTLLSTNLPAGLADPVYWGRCYLWEMSLFIGAAGPLLIAVALGRQNPQRRQVVLDLVVAAPLLVLALGAHTPMFALLYAFAPGFGHFRSWSKFIFPAALFLVLVVAAGADMLLRGKKPSRTVALGGILMGIAAALFGGALFFWPENISWCFSLVAESHESYLPPAFFTQPEVLQTAGTHAGLSLGLSGFVLIFAGATLLFVEKQPLLRWGLPVILALEMIGFAAGLVPMARLSDAMPEALRQFIAAHRGDYRVLNLARPDNGFLLGAGDIGGNNPSVLRRYAEFMTFTQGGDPDYATQYIAFHTSSPLYALLRLRYIFVPNDKGFRVVESMPAPLPRLSLLSDWKTVVGRDAIFSALSDSSFRPAKTVLLESDPAPAPEPGAMGTVKLLSEQSDELVIEAETNKPALLFITDLYETNWRAEALPGSVQTSYQIMPADYVFQAVPLAAGHHRLRIVYAPASFALGVGISAAAWLIWAGLLVWSELRGNTRAGLSPSWRDSGGPR
jgi:hypothetical protein